MTILMLAFALAQTQRPWCAAARAFRSASSGSLESSVIALAASTFPCAIRA